MNTLAFSLIICWFMLIMSIVVCIIYKLCIQVTDESNNEVENQIEERVC